MRNQRLRSTEGWVVGDRTQGKNPRKTGREGAEKETGTEGSAGSRPPSRAGCTDANHNTGSHSAQQAWALPRGADASFSREDC